MKICAMSNPTRMSLAVCKHIVTSKPLAPLYHRAPFANVSRIRGTPPKRNYTHSHSSCVLTEPLTKTIQLDGVRKIIMCNQKTRNAMSLQMMEDLISNITFNQDDPGLRCIVLYGEGKVFSAGHNLKELTTKDGMDYHNQVFSTCTRLMLGIMQCPVPVIAVVQGLAAAAGCQLVATCDIAICTENSTFSTPGVALTRKMMVPWIVEKLVSCQSSEANELYDAAQKLHVILNYSSIQVTIILLSNLEYDIPVTYLHPPHPTDRHSANFGIFCSTPGIAVCRAVPRKIAAHMLFTGIPLTASEALQAGLVSKVVSQENLDEEVQRILDAITNKSRSVLELGKKFLYEQLEMDIKTAYRVGQETMVKNLTLVDCQEGIRSFIEKRKPAWTHGYEKCH